MRAFSILAAFGIIASLVHCSADERAASPDSDASTAGGFARIDSSWEPLVTAFVRVTPEGAHDPSFAEAGVATAPERGEGERRSGAGVSFIQDPARASCDETLIAVFGPVPGDIDPPATAHVYR